MAGTGGTCIHLHVLKALLTLTLLGNSAVTAAAPIVPSSAKYPPPKLSDVEAAVQALKSEQALEVIGKLLYNAAISPREEKFR